MNREEFKQYLAGLPELENYQNAIWRKESLTKLYEKLQPNDHQLTRMYTCDVTYDSTHLSVVRGLIIECHNWLNKHYNSWLSEYNSRERSYAPVDKYIRGPISPEEISSLMKLQKSFPICVIASLMQRTEQFVSSNLAELLKHRA